MTLLNILAPASFILTGLSFLGLLICEQWLLSDTRREPGLFLRMFVRGPNSAMYRAIKGDWPDLKSAQWCRRFARAATLAMSTFALVVLAKVIDETVR